MFKLDRTSSVPLYEQIEKELKILISQPEYIKGEKIPSEIELSAEYGVSRATIRQAINNLVVQGLLVRKKGAGTKINQGGIKGVGRKWKSFSQEMHSLGIEPWNFELHVTWEAVPDDVAIFFKIKKGTKVLKLKRLRGSKSGPFVLFISYFNPILNLTGNEDFNQPLYSILSNVCGCIVKSSHESIYAVNADNILAQKLEIQENTAVLKRVREVFDINKLPVEYNIGFYRSDRFTYSISFDGKD